MIATAASYAICFLLAVASTARVKELSLSPAVESTDGSLTHPVAHGRGRILRFDYVRRGGRPPLSRTESVGLVHSLYTAAA